MDIEKVKQLIDACYEAKRARELLPRLPEGISSSHIQYLDIIERTERHGERARVSDISDALGIPRPGVTRTVKEMESRGLVKKQTSPDDGRVTYISATKTGAELSRIYNEQVFSELLPFLGDISDAEADCMINVISRFHEAMKRAEAQRND